MKCPQCGNEAINVNGKYVCLDCGVQIENEPPKAAAPSINHTFGSEPVVAEPTPVPVVTSVNTPISSATHPVQDMIMANLNDEDQEAIGSFNFGKPSVATTVATQEVEPLPVPKQGPVLGEEVAPIAVEAQGTDTATIEPTSPVITPPEALDESQVSTDVLAAQTLGEEGLDAVAGVKEAPEVAEPAPALEISVPTEPASTNNDFTEFKFVDSPIESIAPLVEASEVATAVESKPLEVSPTAESDDPLNAVIKETENTPTPVVETQEAVTATEAKTFSPDDLAASFEQDPVSESAPVSSASEQKEYFQPASINIQTDLQAEEGEPKVGDLEGVKDKEEKVVATTNSEPQNSESPVSLDDLLEKYDQPEQTDVPVSVATAPASFTGIDTVTAVSPVLQSAAVKNEIPSVESVFGSAANVTAPETVPAQIKADKKGKSSKKLLFIIIGSVIGILLLAVIIFSFVFVKSSPKKTTSLADQDILRISNLVSSAMDAPQNMSAEVSQKIDFSKVTVTDQKPENIKKYEDFFKIPVELQAKWNIDKEDNLSFESKKGGTQDNRVYIAETNKTYVKAAGSWQDSPGLQIPFSGLLFNHQNRGSIFYLTKIESLQDLGGDDLEGTTFSKFKITPKAEVVKDFLNSQSSLLEGLAYESMDSQKLEILAWVDSDGLVQKVTVSGDVHVKSGTYEGTINISTTANYDYDEVSITSPLAFLSKTIF